MEKYNILCLSNQFFDQPLKTNKWHVMTRLSKLGHNVIFVDPPSRFKGLKGLVKKEIPLASFLSGKRKENANLFVYTPLHIFNFKPFSLFNTWFHTTRINKLLATVDQRKTVMWIYHFDYPDLENFIKKFKYDLVLYDVVDEYTAFPEYQRNSTTNKSLVKIIEKIDDFLKVHLSQGGLSGKAWVIHREKWLTSIVDIIFASAPGLVIKFQKILIDAGKSDKLVYFLPNAADYNKFKDVKKMKDQVPEDMNIIPRPRVMTSGAIDTFKMNLPLIESCAKAYPNFSFVLIGPEKVSDPTLNLKGLKALTNVYFLGQKPWEETPKYFAGTDVYFIPYNLNDYTIGGCFPVKFHEALSAGLPTVVTNMPAYKPFFDVCYIAKTEADFVALIKTALEEDSDERFVARQKVAKENSWDGKVEKQLALIQATLANKVQPVIS